MIKIERSNKIDEAKITVQGGKFKEAIGVIKSQPTYRFDPNLCFWIVPIKSISTLVDKFRELDEKIEIDKSIEMRIHENIEYEKKLEKIKNRIDKVNFEVPSMRESSSLYPFQKVGAGFLYLKKRVLLADTVGLGKGQPEDAKILTPTGWKQFKDLKIGDKAIGSNGKATIINGVFKRGVLESYKVTFNDKTSLIVDGDHLWKVIRNNQTKDVVIERFLNTRTLMENFKTKAKYNWKIPVVKPVEFKAKKTFIHPYVLGVLLGDGCLRWNVRISVGYKEIADMVKKFLPKNFILNRKSKGKEEYAICIKKRKAGERNKIYDYLKSKNLNVLSYQKYIPEEYLFNSIQNRLFLLQGLMDTDGYAEKTGHLEFTSSSKKLAMGVIFLVRSLGGIARFHVKKNVFYVYKGEKKRGRVCYRVSISMPPNINPFLAFKQLYVPKTKYPPSKIIRDIRPIGKKKIICISVTAKDHLYVTEKFIVTHNTPQALAAIEKRFCNKIDTLKKCIIICPNSLKANWIKNVKKFFKRNPVSVGNTKPERKMALDYWINSPAKYLVIHYEGVRAEKEELLKAFEKFGPDSVGIVCDEIQYLKNFNILRSRAVQKIAYHKAVKCFYGLSATYIENGIENLFGIFWVIDKTVFGDVHNRFLNSYIETDYFGRIKGYKNIDEVVNKISPYTIRRQKEQVLSQLPKVNYIDYDVELDPEQMALCQDIEMQIVDEINDPNKAMSVARANALTKVNLLLQATLSSELFDAGQHSAKLDELIKIIEGFDSSSKVVVFCHYQKMIEIISRELNKAGFKTIYMHGSSELGQSENRQKTIDHWSESDVKVLVTSDILAEGVDLIASSYLVNFDMLWNPAKMEQRNGRIDRINQKAKQITIINLIAKGTIEERVFAKLEERKKLINTVVEGGYISERINMFSMDGLKKLFPKKRGVVKNK